jgi:hypothetical protein
MTDAVVPFTGWGRGTWGELAFGEGSITNAGASGQVGSVTIVAEANVVLVGVLGTGQIGAVTVEAAANVPVTGLEMVGAVGGVTVIAEANVDVTGVSATGVVGSVAVDAAANVFVTGVSGAAAVGSVTVDAAANVACYRPRGYGRGRHCWHRPADANVLVGSLLAVSAVGTVRIHAADANVGAYWLWHDRRWSAKSSFGAASSLTRIRAISLIHRRRFRRGR